MRAKMWAELIKFMSELHASIDASEILVSAGFSKVKAPNLSRIREEMAKLHAEVRSLVESEVQVISIIIPSLTQLFLVYQPM